MRRGLEIAVVIPAFNEEEAIAAVVRSLPEWVDDRIVVDNGSNDRTPQRAAEAGARVIPEPRRGYGAACLAGIRSLRDPEIVVFMDGDFSDRPDEMSRLVDPILQGEADLVAGSRTLGCREPGALSPLARFGNRLACGLIHLFWSVRYTDLGPYRAIRRSSLLGLGMCDPGFGWMVEMQIKATRAGLRVAEVPVSYRRRIGKSKISGTLKGIVGAGSKILFTIFRAALTGLPSCEGSVEPERVLLFSRYPRPGRTKTRLIPVLGEEGAANLQKRMTEQTWATVREAAVRSGFRAEVCYEGGDEAEIREWLGHGLVLSKQIDGDLGQRMSAAFAHAFQEGVDRVVIMGSDCPRLTSDHIREALSALRRSELVLGPARDGGYYLIGLSRALPELFEEIQWGSSHVMEETLRKASQLGIRAALLETLEDVDRPEDLERFRDEDLGL